MKGQNMRYVIASCCVNHSNIIDKDGPAAGNDDFFCIYECDSLVRCTLGRSVGRYWPLSLQWSFMFEGGLPIREPITMP